MGTYSQVKRNVQDYQFPKKCKKLCCTQIGLNSVKKIALEHSQMDFDQFYQ